MNENKLLLGIDIGTSSIKIAIVDVATQRSIASATIPDTTEREIITPHPGWAEQSPEQWWQDVKAGILKIQESDAIDTKNIMAIGITYQMHGLVLVDKHQRSLRNSIIWCDSRTEKQAQEALQKIGKDKCQTHLLNFPGNFTASKLAWVKENEPEIYQQIDKFMLPGDYIAMRLTGEITSTISMLSEGVFWDFKSNTISEDILNCYRFDKATIADCKPVFANHGTVVKEIATELNIPEGIPVTYKAGDQLNNALSLNVSEPGEVATTAGTSGVIYAVTDQLIYDEASRVNTFAHINYSTEKNRLGVLLCINGAGISNRWIKNFFGNADSYEAMNRIASMVPMGAEGLLYLPFGNGAERMLENKETGSMFAGINVNKHKKEHFYRAVQEGIAFAFRYGLDIMRSNGMEINIIKAGKANMFHSNVFTSVFVNVTGLTLEIYETDGSVGAAIGAGMGLGLYKNEQAAFSKLELVERVTPDASLKEKYESVYQNWKQLLIKHLNN